MWRYRAWCLRGRICIYGRFNGLMLTYGEVRVAGGPNFVLIASLFACVGVLTGVLTYSGIPGRHSNLDSLSITHTLSSLSLSLSLSLIRSPLDR
jgi:hypothetical protein